MVAGGNFRFENGAGGFAQQQIGVADDAGADSRWAVAAACAHRRDAIGEFNFADGAERLRSIAAVHRAAIDIDGRNNIVAGGDIGGHLLDHVALAAAIPQMMVGVDDRALWVDDFLFAQCEPVFARIGVEPAF